MMQLMLSGMGKELMPGNSMAIDTTTRAEYEGLLGLVNRFVPENMINLTETET